MAVSETPWSNFSNADYPTPERLCAASLIDLNDGTKTKALCKLQVYEPGGALSRGGCHAAASVLAGGRGGVDAPQAAKVAAAKKLRNLYVNQLKEDPPESLEKLAGVVENEATEAIK